jgi:putative CocE/NonD family hydrolase
MSVASYFLGRSLGLGKRLCGTSRERGIRVPTESGLTLATEHFAPRLEGPQPTILLRTPYGLRGFAAIAELYAERGYHVVLQACRGTGGSDGTFEPLRHERADGLATLAWIKSQLWFDGRLGTTGPSYLGYTQWAISDAMPQHSAMAVKVSSAEFRSVILPSGAFHLGLWLSWIQLVDSISRGPMAFIRTALRGGIDRITAKASLTVPLEDADLAVTGREVPFWRHWIIDAFRDPKFWEDMDHTHRLGSRTPPVLLVSGWYDIMIDQLLRDYETLRAAGATPQLKIGPWFHVSPELQGDGVRETLPFLDRMLRNEGSNPAKPVSLFITGANEWREFDAYPPGELDMQLWHLNSESTLSFRPAASAPPDSYRYDPRDPTPNLGGAIFAFTGAGPVDQSALEARDDVLVYTSEALITDLTIVGNVRVILYARASLPDADLFVKLCDVDENGVSINICDGLIRKTSSDPAVVDDIWKLNFRLHSTAHCFGEGHRLRILVASGAHPRYARNTGTTEAVGTATKLLPVDIEIFHDHEHPSTIQLPVYEL